MHNFAQPFKLALYYYGITFHLHYITGWDSVGSVPSPLDDPHSDATQPGATLTCTCSTRVFRSYLVVVPVLQFFVVTQQGEDFTPGGKGLPHPSR